MLRIMQRWLGLAKPQAANKPAAASEPVAETAVLLVRVPAQPLPAPAVPVKPAAVQVPACDPLPLTSAATRPDADPSPAAASLGGPRTAGVTSAAMQSAVTPANASVAERASVPLAALGIVSERLLRKLRRAGLQNCEDLLAADAAGLIQRIGAPQSYTARIRRYQRAIRFSRRFSAMTPHEALLLLAAHRRSNAGLASETAGVLRRDLERLLLSSRGQKLAAGRPVPEIQRVRQWITEAKVFQERKQRALRAAAGHSQLPQLVPARNSVD